MRRIFDLWQAKLGSILLSIILYMNLQNSKISVKNFYIPIEYPKLSNNLYYQKNTEKTFLVKLEGSKDLVNYHAQFLKAVIDVNDLQIGENLVEVKKVYNLPNSGIKLTKLGQKIPITIDTLITKTIPVEINLEDEPQIGYIRSSYYIKPQVITITGPKQTLDKFTKIILNPVSVKDLTESFTKNIRLPDLPKNTSILENLKEFTLRVNIIKDLSLIGEQLIVQIPVKCDGLDPNLDADLSVDEISLKFSSATKFNSLQVIQGLQAFVSCNYTYDKKQKKILPSPTPSLAKVRVQKSNELKNIEVLGISPEKILVSYKLKPGVEEKKEPDEIEPESLDEKK
jgi:YbbR domain-containing protein